MFALFRKTVKEISASFTILDGSNLVDTVCTIKVAATKKQNAGYPRDLYIKAN